MTVLIDSWAWIEYFKGSEFGEKAREYIESDQEIIISAISVSEVQGFLLRHGDAYNPDKTLKFMLEVSFVIPVNVSIALEAASLKQELKMGLADALILATARQHACPVVTGDDDFEGKKDVIYIGPKKKPLSEFVGVWSGEVGEEIAKVIEEGRKQFRPQPKPKKDPKEK